MGQYTTRAAVKEALGIPAGVTQSDSRIDGLVAYADRKINQELCLAGMTAQSYTDTVDVGPGARTLITRRIPLLSVSGLSVGGSTIASTDYTFDRCGEVSLLGQGVYFQAGRRQAAITYVAGFTSTDGRGFPPEDLAEAAIQICAAGFNRTGRAGLASESIQGVSVAMDNATGGIPPEAWAAINSYRSPMV